MNQRWLLSLTFVFAAIGFFGLLNHDDNQQVQTDSQGEFSDSDVPVWISTRSLKKGERVNPSDLTGSYISGDKARRYGVFTRQHFSLDSNALSAENIESGSVVTEAMLSKPGDVDYWSLVLGPDNTSYPITFESNSSEITIEVGDSVDVTLITRPDQALTNDKDLGFYQGLTATLLLRDQKVLDVHKREERSGLSKETHLHTVVLSLNQKDTSRLMLAERVGILNVSKSTSTLSPTIHLSDVASGLSKVTELRGQPPRLRTGQGREK